MNKIVIETDGWPSLEIDDLYLRRRTKGEEIVIALRLRTIATMENLGEILTPLLRFKDDIQNIRLSEEIQQANFRTNWRITIEEVE